MLAFLLLFFAAACGGKENVSQNDRINVTQSLQEDESADNISSPEIEEPSEDSYAAVEAAPDSEQSLESGAAGQMQAESDILATYFSVYK